MIHILDRCRRELSEFPEEVRADLADALARLQEGHLLSMPLSRPMPSIGRGVHELRFRDRSGIYRAIYYLAGAGRIHVLHAFQKKTRETPWQNIQIAKKRLPEVIRES
jgi:phage-related protein